MDWNKNINKIHDMEVFGLGPRAAVRGVRRAVCATATAAAAAAHVHRGRVQIYYVWVYVRTPRVIAPRSAKAGAADAEEGALEPRAGFKSSFRLDLSKCHLQVYYLSIIITSERVRACDVIEELYSVRGWWARRAPINPGGPQLGRRGVHWTRGVASPPVRYATRRSARGSELRLAAASERALWAECIALG
ncbi:unnamed protein product, partial [Iphiclides podalirius]